MRTDGGHWDKLYVPGGGSASFPYFSADMVADNRTVPVVEGRQVFRLATTAMPEIVREVLAKQGLSVEDLDLLLMHQANLRINEAVQKHLGLADEKVFNNIQKYGNTTAATLPLVFHEAKEAGRVAGGVARLLHGAGGRPPLGRRARPDVTRRSVPSKARDHPERERGISRPFQDFVKNRSPENRSLYCAASCGALSFSLR